MDPRQIKHMTFTRTLDLPWHVLPFYQCDGEGIHYLSSAKAVVASLEPMLITDRSCFLKPRHL